MNHRTCMFLAAVIALLLMVAPASSFAEESVTCTKVCVGGHPEIQVTPIFESHKYIREPTLPEGIPGRLQAGRQEHLYFRRLSVIAGNICYKAGGYAEEIGASSFTAYWPTLNWFNEVHKRLSKLLQRYDLGYAPDIEDFSGVGILQIHAAKAWWEMSSSTHCVFKLR